MLEILNRKPANWVQNWSHRTSTKELKYDSSLENQFNYKWLNHSLFPKIIAEGSGEFRPCYTWGVMQGTHLAKVLGYDRISVLEFGVAGGRGLISLEKIAQRFESIYDIKMDVYGFDTGSGLPKPKDYRDLPNLYRKNQFHMDVVKLKKRLKKAQLVLGLIEDTIGEFIQSSPAPVAFIAVDLDYYSSTVHALRILVSEEKIILPRVYCYFDDILGRSCCEYVGEGLAIVEFNKSNEMRKIAPISGLKFHLPHPFNNKNWVEKFFMAHIFDHQFYGNPDKLGKNRYLDIQ